jgi:ABC-type antimicrobial peptide transport system permease subunit
MIKNYLNIALRNLWKNKVYSFINTCGLALGISVTMLIGLWVWDEYSHDRFHTHFDDIYRVTELQKQDDGSHLVAVTPGPLAESLKKDFPEIDHTLRIGAQGGLIKNGDHKLELYDIKVVDPSFFTMFDFELLEGSAHTIFNNPDEIVLSEKSAIALFGDRWDSQDIIGKMVTLSSFQVFPLKVMGIAKNLSTNSHIQAEVFLPLKLLEKHDEWSMKWSSNNFHTYLKLHPETNIVDFEKKMETALAKYSEDKDTKLLLQPLSEIYLKSKFDFQTDWGKRSDIFYSYLFSTVGLIILFIAIFNFINLATARSTQRGKEVGVRKMSGAGKNNLVVQFLFESALVVSIALVVSLLVSYSLLPYLNELSNKTLEIPIHAPVFWMILTAFVLVMTFLSGFYPSLVISSFSPSTVLKGIFNFKSGQTFRKSLVIGQFALSMMLVVCTFTIYNQLKFIQNKNLGFDKEQLMYVDLKGDLRSKASLLKEQIAKLSSVASVSATTNNLVNVGNSSNIEWEGQPENPNFLITQINTDADLIDVVNAQIVSGRNFSNLIPSDTSDVFGTYLLNETAVKKMGWNPTTALGKKVKFWGFEGEVVGVVKDFHFRALNQQIEPFIFRYRPKEFYYNLMVKTKPNNVQQAITGITEIYEKIETNYPIKYGFVNQDLDKLYTNDQRTGRLLLFFSILAVLISCMGLFGLVTFATEQRVKEIGIRKVLGASIFSITKLLSTDLIKLVLAAIILACPIAYFLVNKWLQNFAYKIEMSFAVFFMAAFITILVAMATVSYQAIQSAMRSPVKSLKVE